MGLFRTLKFITTHPLTRHRKLAAIARFVRWQVGSRLVGAPVLVDYVNGTRLLVSRGMTGATGNVYVGLHEFEDMAFVAHLLRPGDLFIDVGANIGSYSILAASCGADVIAFEPVAKTFEALRTNISVNHLEKRIQPHRKGVADAPGQLRFTADLDTMNHVAGADEDGETVDVITLDAEIKSDAKCLLKIDVEGFESKVIAGAEQLLRSPRVLGIVVELNGSGLRYGYENRQVHQLLISLGYQTFAYDPFHRSISAREPGAAGNTIYIASASEVADRLRSSGALSIVGVAL